ncbi:hypothetical protein OC842_005412 [Tilletia horrida]|uniref:Uncharacterized protein n=1 Tax=Tilletia horrida TaxID=155126 RepID=A0AAN6G7U0_9BASI|nr:hypothetical protein OC842_005412 [Tilletia horrida]
MGWWWWAQSSSAGQEKGATPARTRTFSCPSALSAARLAERKGVTPSTQQVSIVASSSRAVQSERNDNNDDDGNDLPPKTARTQMVIEVQRAPWRLSFPQPVLQAQPQEILNVMPAPRSPSLTAVAATTEPAPLPNLDVPSPSSPSPRVLDADPLSKPLELAVAVPPTDAPPLSPPVASPTIGPADLITPADASRRASVCTLPSMRHLAHNGSLGKGKGRYMERSGSLRSDDSAAERLPVHVRFEIPAFRPTAPGSTAGSVPHTMSGGRQTPPLLFPRPQSPRSPIPEGPRSLTPPLHLTNQIRAGKFRERRDSTSSLRPISHSPSTPQAHTPQGRATSPPPSVAGPRTVRPTPKRQPVVVLPNSTIGPQQQALHHHVRSSSLNSYVPSATPLCSPPTTGRARIPDRWALPASPPPPPLPPQSRPTVPSAPQGGHRTALTHRLEYSVPSPLYLDTANIPSASPMRARGSPSTLDASQLAATS